ncbi:MAG: beta-lactamase family protein [Bacteroidales bacterium]|nr:beta-lactamase family protein [Bacteroidales bacterium]
MLAATVAACGTVEEKAEKKINHFMEKSGTLGLAVAVVKDGQVVYTGSFGQRSLIDETPLKDGDIFRIASISKSFTTTTLMKLVEEGKISLDDEVSSLTGFPVQNPQFPETPITMKMLLSHSSSLNDSQGYFTLNTLNPATNPDYAKCYNNYEPGTAYEYCNLGFNTIGAIIEKLSGVRFDRYVREVVILPLNLTASFNVDDLPGATFIPLSHTDTTGFAETGKIGFTISEGVYNSIAARLDTAYIMGYTTPVFSPTGGMKISAADLARYMIMHMNYGIDPASGVRIISEENSKLMQTPVVDVDEANLYCLALKRTTNLITGEVMVGHTGSAYGLYSAMFFEPEKKFGIVMMTNGTTADYATYVDGYAPVQREVVNILYSVFIK